MKRMFLFIGLIIVAGFSGIAPVSARENRSPMTCDLGPSKIGQDACRDVRMLVLYTATPSSKPNLAIDAANKSVKMALKSGVASGAVLLQMELPWLTAKALLAYATHC